MILPVPSFPSTPPTCAHPKEKWNASKFTQLHTKSLQQQPATLDKLGLLFIFLWSFIDLFEKGILSKQIWGTELGYTFLTFI